MSSINDPKDILNGEWSCKRIEMNSHSRQHKSYRQLISRCHLSGMVFTEKNTAINNKRLYCISFEKMTHFQRVVKPKRDINANSKSLPFFVQSSSLWWSLLYLTQDKGSQSSNTSPYLSTCIGQVYWWAHPLSITTMQKKMTKWLLDSWGQIVVA